MLPKLCPQEKRRQFGDGRCEILIREKRARD